MCCTWNVRYTAQHYHKTVWYLYCLPLLTYYAFSSTIITQTYRPSLPPIPSISSLFLHRTHSQRGLSWCHSPDCQSCCNAARVNCLNTAKILTQSTVMWNVQSSTFLMLSGKRGDKLTEYHCHLWNKYAKA